MIFNKGPKTVQWGKNGLFNTWYWEKWVSTCEKMKLDSYLIPYTKTNSKWTQDLNIIPETKLLKENTEQKIHGVAFESNF